MDFAAPSSEVDVTRASTEARCTATLKAETLAKPRAVAVAMRPACGRGCEEEGGTPGRERLWEKRGSAMEMIVGGLLS